jgi:hypothetical protein
MSISPMSLGAARVVWQRKIHRVYIVRGFLSGRPNWLPLPLSQASAALPPLVPGGGTHSLVGEGAGGANSNEGKDTLDIT